MKKKILIGFVLMLFIVLALGAVAIMNINQINQSWEDAEKKGAALVDASQDLLVAFLSCRTGEKDFILRYSIKGVEAAKEEYINARFKVSAEEAKKALQWIKAIKAQLDRMKAETIEVEKIEETFDRYVAQVLSAVDDVEKNPTANDDVLGADTTDFVKTAALIKPLVNNIRGEGHKIFEEYVAKAHVIEETTRNLMVILLLIAIVLGAFVAFFVLRILTQAIKTLINSVQQITSASAEIVAASQEQSSGAREQSSAVAETTSAAKELSTTSEQVGESIRKVSEVAAHALAGMAKIKESLGRTNQMVSSLGEKSQKIGKITDMIDDVADQTNLLAVNASIEAARAGDQGRGFTVVADEIRKLSDSTAKSTKEISSLIELIQHEMTNSVMAMEGNLKSVDDEARLAQQTAERSKEIAMSANQQIAGSKQISEAMMNIDEAMKQIVLGAQQTQQAVKDLNKLTEGLNHLANQLK